MRSCLLLSLILLSGPTLLGQSEGEWSLHKDKDGIRVYTRPQPNTSFKAVRAETRLPTEAGTLLAVLWDVGRYAEWMPHTASVRVLEQDERELIYYLRAEAPWPAKDRDGIYHIDLSRQNDTLLLRFRCLPERLPPDPDYVRIPSCSGSWTLVPDPAGELEVEYEMYSEMGGSLPGWLANMGSTGPPMQMIQELRERVAWPEYQNQDFELPDEANR